MNALLPLAIAGLPCLGFGFVAILLFLWLRKAFTPAWLLALFESEGVPSIRLTLAAFIVVFTLFMEYAKEIGDGLVQANFILAGTLLGLGTAKVVGKAFAARPPGPATQVTAKKADVAVAGDATISTPTE